MLYLDKPLYHGKEEVARIVNIDGFVVQSLENDSLKSSIQEININNGISFDLFISFFFFFFLRYKNVTPFVKISKRQGFLELWNISFYFYFSDFIYSSRRYKRILLRKNKRNIRVISIGTMFNPIKRKQMKFQRNNGGDYFTINEYLAASLKRWQFNQL